MSQNKQDHRKRQIVETIHKLYPLWKNDKAEDTKLSRLAGITNQTYKVQHPEFKDAIIYREFGDASDNIFINRDSQQFIYQYVSDHKMGPKILGQNQDVRLESFIQSEGLKTAAMLENENVQNIAYTLRKFHSLHPTQKVSKQSLFTIVFFGHDSPILQKCHNKMNKNVFNQKQLKILQELKSWVTKQEVQFLRKATQHLQKQKLVFSHNDLLSGNILIRKKDHKIIFIDYQYSCFNYPIYDIANYFAEAAINYDVKEEPYFQINKLTKEQQKVVDQFIKCYILAEGKHYHDYKQIVQKKQNLNEEQQKQFTNLRQNFVIGDMLSNVMWGWWAIIVSKNQNIQFDYISFAKYRYDRYHELKNQVIKKFNL